MPDTKVQMNVTLTDGTVINAGQFTVPEGPPGTPGTNGKDGVTPLENINIIKLINVPTVDSSYAMQGSDFNRTPVTGDIAVLTVNYMVRLFIDSFQWINYSGIMGSFQCKSVFELGVGIKSVSVVEVTA
nr:MAG TPA: nucleoid-associated protein [Caudoviricetes sp.]